MHKLIPSRPLHTVQAQGTIRDMKEIVESLRKDQEATYSLMEAQRLGLIPWARNVRTLRKIIDADIESGNLFGAIVTGTASQRRYLLTARGIIKYLQTYGPALMGTVRKPKQKIYGKRRSNRKTKSAGTGKGGKTR